MLPSEVAASSISWIWSRPWIVALVALAALLDPLDRPAEPPRERERERLLGVDVELRAEPAADVGRDDAELRLRDPDDHREQRDARDVRHLRRRPQRELARRGNRLDDHAARLDRVRDQPLLAVALADGHVGLGEQPVDVARGEVPRVAAVGAELLVHERRALLERGLGVDHGRQRLVVDLDELGRVLAPRRGSSRRRPRPRRRRTAPCRSASGRWVGASCPRSGATRTGSDACHSSVELGAGEGARRRRACASAPPTSTCGCARARTGCGRRPSRPCPAGSCRRRTWPGRSGARVLLALDRRADDPADLDGSRSSRPHPLGGLLHRPDDVVVAGAAADVALERVADLLLGRARVLAQQAHRGEHEAGRAVAALEARGARERLLDGVQRAVRREPSIVVISRPSAWTPSTVQDLTDSPSSSTVQAPQEDVSQPTFVPVRPSRSRRT